MSQPGQTGDRRVPTALAVLLFFVSGAVALVIETTWLRWFRLLFGATAPAASATLVAFFAGNALGAALAAGRVPRLRRPLLAYGGLELAAAVWGLAVPLLLALGEGASAAGYDALRTHPGLLTAVRFAIALGATLPAAVCLGATLPAMGAALLPGAGALGSGGAGLYAVNLLGAATGTALAAFWLPDRIGVNATYRAALVAQLLVGLAAIALGRGRAAGPSPAPARSPAPRPRAPLGARALMALAALSGFGSFAAQVLLVHAFTQIFNFSVYAFGAVLVTVLATLGVGAGLVALLERGRLLDPRALLGGALLAAALGLAAFPQLLYVTSDGLRFLGSEDEWPGYLGVALWTAVRTAGLPLLAAALVFPAVFAAAGVGGAGHAARHLGRLTAANTLGAIAGALVAPFVLLPLVGLWNAFAVTALVYAAPALLLPGAGRGERPVRLALLGVGALGVVAFANPARLPLARLAAGETLVVETASAAGVVAVVESDGERLIRTDNHYSLGGTSQRIQQERQGHLPLLLHPGARSVAFVGSATGISAGAAIAHPVDRIHLVELTPGVALAAERYFADANHRVHEDPRARTILDDARNYLRATRDRFDVIVADLFVPWRAGTGSLYSREHFEAVRAHLEPGGLFCQWLPLYQLGEEEFRIIAATFLDVFPEAAVFRGDFFGRHPIAALVGWADRRARPRAVSRAAERLARAGVADRWVTHPDGVWSLYVGPLGPLAGELAGVPRNTDGWPRIEFLAARTHLGGTRGKLDPMVGLEWIAFSQALFNAARTQGDPIYPDLPAAARRASLGGAWLQTAGAHWIAGDKTRAANSLAQAAEHLPRALFADAEADETAAQVWWR